MLIRFFDAGNPLFDAAYDPPKRQKAKKVEATADREKMMALYSKALAGLPALHGSSNKKRKLNIFSCSTNQKPQFSKTEQLQSELHAKQ